ncbi:MAG: hypothetical protein ACREKH_00625 [Candidatus Rokuibacteriota bacterium]
MADTCSFCRRTDGTHTGACKKHKESRREGCKLCARFAPAKCYRHGGAARQPGSRPTKKSPPRGARSKPLATAGRRAPVLVSANGAKALLVDHLEEELVQKRAEVRVLESMLAKAKV